MKFDTDAEHSQFHLVPFSSGNLDIRNMEQPAETETIQLIAVLGVLDKSQDTVSSILKIRKETVGKVEKWLRVEDVQTVSSILSDEVLKTTIIRDLPAFEQVSRDIMVRACLVDRAAILLHYKGTVPDENLEEKLRQHQNELAEQAENRLDAKLNKQKDSLIESTQRLLDKKLAQNKDDIARMAKESSEVKEFPKNLEHHYDGLTKAANKLIEALNIFDNLKVDDYTSLSDAILMYKNVRLRTILEDQLVIGLFSHLKEDIIELKPLSGWGDLTKKHITYALKKKISTKAAKRDFIGKCELCPTTQ